MTKKGVHRGEIVKATVKQSGISMTDLAPKINYSRAYLYTLWENPNLSFDIILQIGRAIKHDFRQEFPDMYVFDSKEVQEPTADYKNMAELLKECRNEKKEYRDKYLNILEEYNALLKKTIDTK